MNDTHYTDYTGEGAYYDTPPPTYEEATRQVSPPPSRRTDITFGPMQIWQTPRGCVPNPLGVGYVDVTGRTEPRTTGSRGNTQVVPPRITAPGTQYTYGPAGIAANNVHVLPNPARPYEHGVVVSNGVTVTGVDFTKVIFHPGGGLSFPAQQS